MNKSAMLVGFYLQRFNRLPYLMSVLKYFPMSMIKVGKYTSIVSIKSLHDTGIGIAPESLL